MEACRQGCREMPVRLRTGFALSAQPIFGPSLRPWAEINRLAGWGYILQPYGSRTALDFRWVIECKAS